MAPSARELLAAAAASSEDLETVTFVSYPVFTAEGRFFGTLCGASKEMVEIKQQVLELMRGCAILIGQRLRATAPARSTQ